MNKQIVDENFDWDNNLYVFARVNPGVWVSYRQEIKIGQWSPVANTGGRRYYVKLPLKFQPELWNSLVEDMNFLLTAYFLTDFEPRELLDFKPKTSKEDILLQTYLTFGQATFIELPNANDLSKEPNTINSPRIIGLSIFNSPVRDIQFSKDYPWDELKKHYSFLLKNNEYLKPLMLIRESFMNFNMVTSSTTHPRENELIIGIILLVSALEKLMLNPENDDNTLRFTLIGAILYQNNFPKDSGLQFGVPKLSFQEAKILFNILYKIRSDIAHGRLETLSKKTNKSWQKLAQIFKVTIPDNLEFSARIKLYSFVMELLQAHMAIFIKYSLEDFFKKSD